MRSLASGRPGSFSRLNTLKRNNFRPWISGLLAGALTLGWVLHDLAIFATSGRPQLALELWPKSALAVLLGTAVGLLGGLLQGVLLVGFVGAIVLSVPPVFRLLERSPAEAWLPRAVALLLLAHILLAFVAARRGSDGSGDPSRASTTGRFGPGSTILAGIGAGVLACILRSVVAGDGWFVVSTPLAIAAAMLLATAWIQPALLRYGLALTALALSCLWILPKVTHMPRTGKDLAPPEQVAQGPSVIFIILDTVRADHISGYGYERETTPKLDRFAELHATRYTAARSTSSWTLPSTASLYTGLLPSQHGARLSGLVPSRFIRTFRRSLKSCEPTATRPRTCSRTGSTSAASTGSIVGSSAWTMPNPAGWIATWP